jgi:hypothetical protein
LTKEINPEFKKIYEDKEINEQAIKSSTLKALGIQTPSSEYMQSLRYTREGYSDIVGGKISQVQKAFWESMPIEERTARAKKSVENYEKWWNSFSRDEILDMIAAQEDEIDLLKRFHNSEIGKSHRTTKSQQKETPEQPENTNHTNGANKVHVDSKLSKDDLFKVWATNNLRIFKEGLTEYDKKKIETKRAQNRIEWWNSMSPVEKTEYINKLKITSEPLRYAMIDAWNKNPDILIELAFTLIKEHVENPIDAVMGSAEFSERMSEVMTGFWGEHSDFADRLGESIKESHARVKDAITNGNFDNIKKEILDSRAARENTLKNQIKNYKAIVNNSSYLKYPEYIKHFVDAYCKNEKLNTGILPTQYFIDFFDVTSEGLPEDKIVSWRKILDGAELNINDYQNILVICNHETPNASIMNRALEAAASDILYDCTGDAEVYKFSQADCKQALNQINKGDSNIALFSNKLGKKFNIPIKNHKIDSAKLDKLYDQYKQPINPYSTLCIVNRYFDINPSLNDEDYAKTYESFSNYVELYGSSIKIICAKHSKYPPEVKAAFTEKFINNLAKEMPLENVIVYNKTVSDYKREAELENLIKKLRRKYNSVPKSIFDFYADEFIKTYRAKPYLSVSEAEMTFCQPLKSPTQNQSIMIFPRGQMTLENNAILLCMEQALADALYNATGEEKVYALRLEEMMYIVELAELIENPKQETITTATTLLNEPVKLNLKKKLNMFQVEKLYNNYIDNFLETNAECKMENREFSEEDMLFALNPNEDMPKIDEYTLKRISGSTI